MRRTFKQSNLLLAGMLAALATGQSYHLPSIQIPRESNPILDGLNAKAEERAKAAEAEVIERARLKRERKSRR